MIRNVNKEKRVTFCKQLVADSENFVDIIFTDECTVQLHDNKVVIYHLKDEVVPPIPGMMFWIVVLLKTMLVGENALFER
jgi:hypothetical protein